MWGSVFIEVILKTTINSKWTLKEVSVLSFTQTGNEATTFSSVQFSSVMSNSVTP